MIKPPLKIETNHQGYALIGYVILNAVKAQFVATSIKVEIETYEEFKPEDFNSEEECLTEQKNQTMFVEIPIIASVVNHTRLFSVIDIQENHDNANQSDPIPIYLLDVLESKKVPISFV